MAEQPFDLVLEHLKSLQSALARVERRQQDDGARLLRVEAELNRINTRLGLVDG